MNSALIIIFAVLLFSLYLGIRAKKGKKMDLEQWTVGGRGFGAMFVFLLMAGEIYTTFTFLGGSGWAYGKGAPTFYILAYGSLAYVMSYWMLPAIWRYAKANNLMSQSDFFVSKYKSPALGVLVSLVGVAALVPYLVLQFQGLGIIVSAASYGSISSTVAVWIGAIAVTIYVMISGIHGSAWTAVVKDIMILVIVLFMGIYLPYHYFGGFQTMFEAIDKAKPGYLVFPKTGMSIYWYISTVLLTALGFYMWPHSFAASYSAKDAKTFKKNAIILPLYQLILLFVFFVGFVAFLKVPGLKNGDTSLLELSKATFSPWIVGIIGAGGLLTALVPGSLILMASSTLLAKNVYKVFAPSTSEQQVAQIAKFMVPVVALIAVMFALRGGSAIVTLLLMGYSLVTQAFPSFLFSMMKKNFVTKQGAFAGIVAGVLTVSYVTISGSTVGKLFPFLPQAMKDFNVGIIALLVNLIVLTVVSLLTQGMVSSRSNKEGVEVAK